MSTSLLEGPFRTLGETDLCRTNGRVLTVIGLVIEASGLRAAIGERCSIEPGRRRAEPVPAEVVGFREGRTLLMPLGEMHGVGPGTKVLGSGPPFRVPVGPALLG